MIIFLSTSLIMCFVSSKELSHRDGSFEHPQHMFWLRNQNNNFQLRTLIWRSGYMRHIRLISIYIGNLNYKIEIPFYLPVFCIESVIFFFYKIQCNVIFYAKRELYLLLRIHRHLACGDVSIVVFCCLYFT